MGQNFAGSDNPMTLRRIVNDLEMKVANKDARIAEIEAEVAEERRVNTNILRQWEKDNAFNREQIAAALECGAREFAEWCEKNPEPKWDTSPFKYRLARFLGTTRCR